MFKDEIITVWTSGTVMTLLIRIRQFLDKLLHQWESPPVVCCLQELTLRHLCGRHIPVFWLGKSSIFTITALTLTTADRAAVLKRNTEPFWFNAPHVAFTLQERTVMAQQLPVLAPDQHWRIQVQTRVNYARWLLRSTVTAKANGSRNAFW